MKQLLHDFIDSLTEEGAAWLHGFISHLFHKDKPKDVTPISATSEGADTGNDRPKDPPPHP